MLTHRRTAALNFRRDGVVEYRLVSFDLPARAVLFRPPRFWMVSVHSAQPMLPRVFESTFWPLKQVRHSINGRRMIADGWAQRCGMLIATMLVGGNRR